MQKGEYYKTRLPEAIKCYTRNSTKTAITVPTFLLEEIKRRKQNEGLKTTVSQIASVALLFSLFGEHNFVDPIDALKEAFERYNGASQTEKDTAGDIIRMILEKYQ